jgi:hypothetical protein
MMSLDKKLQNTENELVELYFYLKEIVDDMYNSYPPGHSARPDCRYLDNQLNILKNLICNYFGYMHLGDSIVKNPEYQKSSYSLMKAMKIAEKYRK